MKLHTNRTPVFLRVRTCMFLSMERDNGLVTLACTRDHLSVSGHMFLENCTKASHPNFDETEAETVTQIFTIW